MVKAEAGWTLLVTPARSLLFRRQTHSLLAALLLFGLVFLFLQSHGAAHPADSGKIRASEKSRAFEKSRQNDDNLNHVFNATLGFGEIFAVTSTTRSDRRDGIVLGAALSELKINLFEGAEASHINELHDSVPPTNLDQRLKGAELGCFRSHMNVMHEIVQRNLSSALILEDDADWDVRIRTQLRDLALSTRALIQPLADDDKQEASHDGANVKKPRYADETFPEPHNDSHANTPPPLDLAHLPNTVRPSVSPYGDGWDLLWLGHCAHYIPAHISIDGGRRVPKGRVAHHSDETVPPQDKLWVHTKPYNIVEEYPAQTRVVHHSLTGACSQAYAVSQAGARKLLSEIALNPTINPFDLGLRAWCEGTGGLSKNLCLTVSPALFGQHKAVGPEGTASTIRPDGNDKRFRVKAATDLIRQSVRVNKDVILGGYRKPLIDQYEEAAAGRPMDQFA